MIAPLLIIQRVADQSALTSETIAPRSVGSSRPRSSTLIGRRRMSSVSEQGVGIETVVDIHLDKV